MNERQEKIVDIISKNIIGTQAELQAALEREGVRAAQATISRDIKALKLVRELTPQGKYRYVRPRERTVDAEQRLRAIFRECVVSIDRAQNIVVIKTLPSLAPAACAALDKMKVPGLVGTIAGDDTAFLAMRDDDAAEQLVRRIGRGI